MFWEFSSDLLAPVQPIFENEITETGDTCHYNLKGMKKKPAYKFFKKHFSYAAASICDNGNQRPLTLDDMLKEN
jgi:hypothetical protein